MTSVQLAQASNAAVYATMVTLAIDTASAWSTVAVVDGGVVLAEQEHHLQQQQLLLQQAMQQGLLVALAYVVLFLSLAWARFTQKDITS